MASATLERRKEAERNLKVRGLSPTSAQISTESRKLLQERNFQQAQKKVEETKKQATAPVVKKSMRVIPSIPQIGGTGALPTPSPSLSQSISSASPESFTQIGPVMQRSLGVSTPVGSPMTTFESPRSIGETPVSVFEQQVADVLKNQLVAETGQLRQAIRGTSEQLIAAPRGLQATGMFQGLIPSQASRLTDIERGGLSSLFSGLSGLAEQRQTRSEKLLERAGAVFKERQEIQREEKKILEQRRQASVNDFINFRDTLREGGIQLDPNIGPDFLKRIQSAENPEQILEDYKVAAFSTQKVKQLFAPKKTGGAGVTAEDKESKKLKQAADLAKAMVDSQIWTINEGKDYVKQFMGATTSNITEEDKKETQEILNNPETAIQEARDDGESDVAIINMLIRLGMEPRRAVKEVTGKVLPGEEDSFTSTAKGIANFLKPPKYSPKPPIQGLSFSQGPL